MKLFQTPETFASHIPMFLFATGTVFSSMIWLLHIFWMAIIGTPPSNYYVSMPYAGLNYIQLCVLIFSGFIVLGTILLLFGKRKKFSAALIILSLSIGTNTLLMKAIFKKGHLMSMQGLVQGLKEFDPNDQEGPWYHSPSMVLFNHEALTIDIRRWNEVESEKFEPTIDIVSVVGDWILETDEYTGICRIGCGAFFFAFDFYLEVNGELWGEKKYAPQKIIKEDERYKIVLRGGGRRGADSFYKSWSKNIISSLEEGVYLEMSQDKQSFFMYPDETKDGSSLGPFVRK
jgi:hypothetical protein